MALLQLVLESIRPKGGYLVFFIIHLWVLIVEVNVTVLEVVYPQTNSSFLAY